MFMQKKTKKTTRSMKSMSMVESLEGRRMFSASAGLGGDALLADGKVATHDISFVKREDKSSPGLSALKIKFTDILVT